MASKQHGNLDSTDGLHGIVASDVADAAALPASPAASELGTVRRTTGTHDIHVLTGTAPTEWKRVAWGTEIASCVSATTTAQTTATNAATAAAAAQSTANTALANAATAQTTANSAAAGGASGTQLFDAGGTSSF